MTHKYKGKEYEVQTGPRGGHFILTEDGKKVAVKVPKEKVVKKKVLDPIKKQEEKPTLKHYIGYYYEYNEDGDIIDDFKEWTEAYSYDEAKEYFIDNYRHDPLVKLDMVTRE